MVPTAPDWAAWVGIMVTTHFDLVSGPFQVPGGPKRAFWPRSLNFHGPISWATFFCFKNRLVGCPEHRSGMPCSSSTVIAHMEPPSSRKRPKTGKKGPFGPQKTLLGAPELLGGPRVASLGPNGHRLVRLMVTTHFELVSGLCWAPRGPKWPIWPKMPLLGVPVVLGVSGGTRFGPKCPRVFHCIAWYFIALHGIT